VLIEADLAVLGKIGEFGQPVIKKKAGAAPALRSWALHARLLDRAPVTAQDCLGQRGIAAGIGVRVTCAL